MNYGLVQNWMSSPVVSVSKETTLPDARKIINERQIRALPVLDNNRLVGIITRRGLLRFDLSFLEDQTPYLKIDLSEERIGEVMTPKPLTVLPQSLIPKAARIMLENKITALPVVDNSRVVGMLTTSDIHRFILEEYPGLQRKKQVCHYMTSELVTIDPETSLLEAHRLMGTKRIRSLIVMEDDTMVGLVTRTDLMSSDPSRLASRNHQDISLKILAQPVKRLMTRRIITIPQNALLTDAALLMLKNKIHCLPVIDKDNKLSGIITESDLFMMVVQKFY